MVEKKCAKCGKSLANLPRLSVRSYCSDAHRYQGRRDAAREVFDAWRSESLSDQDPEDALLSLAPVGAWLYRLSCPALGNGGRRYFPPGDMLRLRPFADPVVPLPGNYAATFYDQFGDLMTPAPIGSISVARATRSLTVTQGDTKP